MTTRSANVTTRSNGAAPNGMHATNAGKNGVARSPSAERAKRAASPIRSPAASNGGMRAAKPKPGTAALEDGFEFGGTWGALALIVWSHAQLYYFWYCIMHNNSSLYIRDWAHFAAKVGSECAPTVRTVGAYVVFIIAQAVLALAVPGHEVQGYPLPHLGGKRLSYCCNGLGCWTASLLLLYWLHAYGYFDLASVQADLGSYMTSAIVVADFTAIGAYFGALAVGTQHRMSGHRLYDFFMGAPLNPRLGSLDLKMFTEARVSWIVLFVLTLSATLLQYRRYGTVSLPMAFMLLAHTLYTHTIMRGEEGIPVTWDIFYEKWGWMLIFWNLAGVPFTYCYQSFYLASLPPFEHSTPYTVACFALLIAGWCARATMLCGVLASAPDARHALPALETLRSPLRAHAPSCRPPAAYARSAARRYVWDVSNSQRCYFRMQQEGTFRWRLGLFLPWLPGRFIRVRVGARGCTAMRGGTVRAWRWALALGWLLSVSCPPTARRWPTACPVLPLLIR